jgi:Rhodopirellula transposase DDE domain
MGTQQAQLPSSNEQSTHCGAEDGLRPLTSHEVVVKLIGKTTTDAGLTIQAELDENTYPTGVKVSDKNMKGLNLYPAKFHGKDWNDSIKSEQ